VVVNQANPDDRRPAGGNQQVNKMSIHFPTPLPTAPLPRTAGAVAAAYNAAGNDYVAYADGDAKRLFAFEGVHAYADRRLWSALAAKLRLLRAAGRDSITMLDAGCGPGTWLRRLIVHARELGFTTITARGFDIAGSQVDTARRMARDLAALPGVSLTLDVGDLTQPLPEDDASVDLTICLYSVLNHLPGDALPKVVAEFSRVTRCFFVTTVRSIGSLPTIFVDSIDEARSVKLDWSSDRCDIELRNGRRLSLHAHLFGQNEMRSLFARHFAVEDLCGLDIFHSRFAAVSGWNPQSISFEPSIARELGQLEEAYARDGSFIERATHLMLVARARPIQVA
jgi:SAM-dependent methyltransferase